MAEKSKTAPKTDPKVKRREPGPKTRRPVIPASFQISRQVNPMRDILAEAEVGKPASPAPLEPDAQQVNESSELITYYSGTVSDPLPEHLNPSIIGPVISGGPSGFTGPPDITGPSIFDGPSESRLWDRQIDGPSGFTGPVKSTYPEERLSPLESAERAYSLRPEFSLLNSLPDVPGHLPLFHQVTDYLDRQIPPSEQCVYRQLYRLTWGFGRGTVTISNGKLGERSGVGESTAKSATKGLEGKGLIKKLDRVAGFNTNQGITWLVYPPPALLKYLRVQGEKKKRPVKITGPVKSDGPSRSDPMKDIVLFTNEHTQTQAGVSGASRFTFEECRRYADHLKQTGQGITNPGGYATKIFRSGEADELIEAFLNPTQKSSIDNCPDCHGSAFVYIDTDNRDKGVKPCKHERLTPTI